MPEGTFFLEGKPAKECGFERGGKHKQKIVQEPERQHESW